MDHLLIRRDLITLMRDPASHPRKAGSLTDQHGGVPAVVVGRKVRVRPLINLPNRPRVSCHMNDNYCVAPLYVTQLTGNKETLELCQTLM